MISITPAIKSLKIRNLGLIRKADMKFTKGINIVFGVNGSGKTTVMNALCHLLGDTEILFKPNKHKKQNESTVIESEFMYKGVYKKITKIPNSDYIRMVSVLKSLGKGSLVRGRGYDEIRRALSAGEKFYIEIYEVLKQASEGQAVILDDVISFLDEKHRGKIFEMAKKSNAQIIMTARREDELVKGANVIRLKMVKRNGLPAVYS